MQNAAHVFVQGELTTREYDRTIKVPAGKGKTVEHTVPQLVVGQTGETVLDLFGGSGSTMIACEKHSRRARLMELDPKYVDVSVRRWQTFSGGTATLQADGRTFDQVALERAA